MHAVNREHALTEHLSSLEHQRFVHKHKHKHTLQDMIVIAIVAMPCGADG